MSDGAGAANTGAASTLRRFIVVGGVGFCLDAALLALLTGLAGWTPWHARLVSAFAAIVATWLLNRHYTFAGRTMKRWSIEALLYLLTQACGLTVNFGVFGACLGILPRPGGMPLPAQMAGAAAALAFNFGVSNYVLYARRKQNDLMLPASQRGCDDRLT